MLPISEPKYGVKICKHIAKRAKNTAKSSHMWDTGDGCQIPQTISGSQIFSGIHKTQHKCLLYQLTCLHLLEKKNT